MPGVTCLAFTPDTRSVVIGEQRGALQAFDARTSQAGIAFDGHRLAVTALAVSSDGKYLVSGSADRTARLWDAATGNQFTFSTTTMVP